MKWPELADGSNYVFGVLECMKKGRGVFAVVQMHVMITRLLYIQEIKRHEFGLANYRSAFRDVLMFFKYWCVFNVSSNNKKNPSCFLIAEVPPVL